MFRVQSSSLRSLGLAVLMGGLLAGSLAGCGARRRLQAAETETAAPAGVVTAASSGPAASATSATSLGDQIDTELQKMSAELNNADTLNDFSTALPPDAATSVPATAASVAGAPTDTPAPNTPVADAATVAPKPTTAPSGADQGAQIDQALGSMLDQLNKTDTVPEGANP